MVWFLAPNKVTTLCLRKPELPEKKSQKKNPAKDKRLVEAKKKEIEKQLQHFSVC
ncbi:hypothetical protein HCG48_15245 [Oxynema aestuarii AP17]|uniref:Uncharacterized protein n=1 Tax=Oxynema aestuarii AP17 TaxID=2064643 RepID=A0A6H1U008_9CYAN|nr:hypothetical protein HCG48_15245 [Oxynema aestuarii AP17]